MNPASTFSSVVLPQPDGPSATVSDASPRLKLTCDSAGISGVEPIFVFSPDGYARGGELAVLRAGRGVQFGVNWLLGTIESATVTGGA